MKRRLSVAISLIGDTQVVFLDEPTTSLDPESRNHLWKVINLAKATRAIILTSAKIIIIMIVFYPDNHNPESVQQLHKGVIFVHDLSQRRTKTSLQKWAVEISTTGTFSAPLGSGGPGGLPVPYLIIGYKADIAAKESTRGSSGNLDAKESRYDKEAVINFFHMGLFGRGLNTNFHLKAVSKH
ncbi:putative GTP-binding protein [Acorus calamus]|uniref:GTP-binding protein n=1 Tax=Acorus calamus TaxID=4465 RepID=A0AAV9D9R8_ACOCL|nr:putative GTP-binding protein [Acorus calamus]